MGREVEQSNLKRDSYLLMPYFHGFSTKIVFSAYHRNDMKKRKLRF